MKKRTNKKLALNKQKISELSGGNMGDVKGGCTTGFCDTRTFDVRCLVTRKRTCLCPTETFDIDRCGVDSVRICLA